MCVCSWQSDRNSGAVKATEMRLKCLKREETHTGGGKEKRSICFSSSRCAIVACISCSL